MCCKACRPRRHCSVGEILDLLEVEAGTGPRLPRPSTRSCSRAGRADIQEVGKRSKEPGLPALGAVVVPNLAIDDLEGT
eukprot:2097041-Lingulodinium_polyedra.AAC.1